MSAILGDIPRDIFKGVGVTSAIFLMSLFIPIAGFLFSLLIPLCALFYRSQLGRKRGAAVSLISGAVMIMAVGGMSFDMVYFAELLALGYVLGELFDRGLAVEKTVLYAGGIILGTGAAGLLLYSGAAGIGLVQTVTEFVSKNLQMTLVLYQNMGSDEEIIHAVSNSLESIQYALIRIIPSLTTAGVLLVTWMTLIMAKPVLTRGGLRYPEFGPLNLWKPPEYLVWCVIGCGLLLMWPERAMKLIGINGLIVLMTIYFFSGIAIVSYYFEKKQFPLMLKFFFYSLIALQQIALFLVIGLGFFDMWLNFRKLEIPNSEK
jgi:uncharacterized protein YybS (DUF2232 family)